MNELSPAVVVDASTLVDLLAATDRAEAARRALEGAALHAPAHLDVEVLSALGRLHRAGALTIGDVAGALRSLSEAPIARHALTDLLDEAWQRRDAHRLTDALYVALAARLGAPLVTSDERLARAFPGAVVPR